jgi:hypothetical protein
VGAWGSGGTWRGATIGSGGGAVMGSREAGKRETTTGGRKWEGT